MDFFDTITFRRKKRTQSLSDSKDNNITTSSNNSSIDVTACSLPDDENNTQIRELKSQIDNLKLELSIAHNEISNLSLENSDLKKQLQEINSKHEIVKKATKKLTSKTCTPTRKLRNSTPHKTPSQTLQKSAKGIKSNNANYNTHKNEQPKLPAMPASPVSPIKTTPNRDTGRKKRKLCILSNWNQNGDIQDVLENTYTQYFEYIRCLYPNSRLNNLLLNVHNKVQDFDLDDYCIIMIGEQDFKGTEDPITIVKLIRETLKPITHTNIIICCPTFVRGALILNYKIEMFNNLLWMDVEYYKYAYLFDTNYDLSLDQFSSSTGKINKYGIKSVYDTIFQCLLLDIQTYSIDCDVDLSIPIQKENKGIKMKSTFFRG